MGISVGVPLVLVLLGLFSLGHGDIFHTPPADSTTESLRKDMALGDINIDVPALYSFGDAYVEAGNNFYLGKNVSHFKFRPYGIDNLNHEPTGTSSNGRNVVNFIAQVFGLPTPPPVLSMSDLDRQRTLTGASFASAGSAILPESPGMADFMGDILCLDEQIDLFENITQQALKTKFNSRESAAEYYSKSLFFINSGGNDMEAQWRAQYLNQYEDTPEKYNTMVSEEFVKKIERLYKLGARKFVINNVPPMYCMPDKLNSSIPTSCLEYEDNKRIVNFNKMVTDSFKKLQSNLVGSKFFFGDVYTIFQDVLTDLDSKLYGFTEKTSSCCITAERSPCSKDSVPCGKRGEHVYFDNWHPTERMHFVWAWRLLKDSAVGSPTNLIEFVRP